MIKNFTNIISRKKREKYLRNMLDELLEKRDFSTKIYSLHKMKENGSITADEFKALDDILMGRCIFCSVRNKQIINA